MVKPHNIIIKKILAFAFLLCSFLFLGTKTYADEINLSSSGNGSDSNNQITVQSASNTSVSQNNSTSITNNSSSSANSGGNNASSNTGGSAQIQTGNATVNTTVTNQNINSNQATNNCQCETTINSQITGNGSSSNSQITTSIVNNLTSNQNNVANIANTITSVGNSGNNTANHNNGNVTIQTGNVVSAINVQNKNINNSVRDLSKTQITLKAKISGNGDGSENSISESIASDVNVESNNIAHILNTITQKLNSGGNTADKNNGNVLITTGDVTGTVMLKNEGINSNITQVNCGCKPTPPPPPPPCISNCQGGGGNPPPGGSTPSSNPSSSSSSGGVGGSSSSSGSVLGAATGPTLPSTGAYWMFLLTIACFVMFLMGLYLRLHSGNSPPYAYVYA